jgi:predicted Zn-dependent protease
VAPPGFTLDNTAQAVLGLKEGGGEALRVDVVSVPAEQSLPDYLKSGWMENVDPASVEEFSVNGFQTATATSSGGNWSFRIFAVRFGSDVYRFIFAAKNRTAQVDQQFRESIMTFRRMTLKESQQVKSLRLKVVTVGANDTVEKLAHRMATADHSLDRFRVLNGLGPHDRLKPGEKVKIVAE